MQENQTDILSEIVLNINTIKRKQLLPWWIKVFMWIFLIFGAFVPFGIILGILGYNFQLTLYGLETNEPISLIGVIIIALFIFKGITAFGLLKEKDCAIMLGIVDAISGILICILIMLYPLINKAKQGNISFRLELILLIPYLFRLVKIKSSWEKALQPL